MKLEKLLKNIEVEKSYNFKDTQISSIHSDSRKVKAHSLFIAVKGEKFDGNNFIKQAIKLGANVVMFEGAYNIISKKVIFIKVHDTRKAVAIIAKNFYKDPSSKIKLVGITGTNGKTTIATSLFNISRSLGFHCALLSTIENRIDNKIFEAKNTTPDPISINKFLNDAVIHKCKFAFMECSSHAIDQKRIYGLNFAGSIFTNLTRDHLDYHKTFRKYAMAKKQFFDLLSKKSFAIANKDDRWSGYMLSSTNAKKYFFSINKKSDFRGKILTQNMSGLCVQVGNDIIGSKFLGKYNAYNILAIYITCILLKLPKNKVLESIMRLEPPSGRLEFIKSKHGIYGIVDYAHTPDALLNVLSTLKKIKNGKSKIITVMGCGGDRDKTKRPIMGQIAVKMSGSVIFTSDNPRSENPLMILNDITKNLKQKNYIKVTDRKSAIKKAVFLAKSGDIVLIAGKGHEDYQIFKDKTVYFSDQKELSKNFK